MLNLMSILHPLVKVATCEVSDTGYQLGNPFATALVTPQSTISCKKCPVLQQT